MKLTATSIILPKCPHCGKLAAGELLRIIKLATDAAQEIVYRCPETAAGITPTWVHVQANEEVDRT